jgi:hypothetical protein
VRIYRRYVGSARALTAAIAAVLMVGGCAGGEKQIAMNTPPSGVATTTAAPMPSAPPTPQIEHPSPARPAGYVSAQWWNDGPWPFTVQAGTLLCGLPQRVTFTANGVMYALNGAAKSTGQFEEVESIWRDSNVPGVKVNLGSMINRGRQLC